MITADMSLYIFLAGFLSILVLRFYRGKYWYIFLILGFGLIGLIFVVDDVTILTGNNEKQKYITLKNQYFISKNQIGGNREEKTYIDFITKYTNDSPDKKSRF